jgi:hypothetical protein
MSLNSRLQNSIDSSFEDIHALSLELAPYISSMPPEYTGAIYSPSGEGIQDEEHLHFPSPEFFELIIWNIVIAFWVNIAASYFYERYFSDSRLKSKDEINKIEKEVLETIKEREININLKVIKLNFSKQTKSRAVTLLTNYGVPQEEAKEKAEEINSKLLENLENFESDAKEDGEIN